MARRISSILSIGSSNSDKTQSSNSSRGSSSIHPTRPSAEQSAFAKLTANSKAEPRPTNNLQDLHSNQSSGFPPPLKSSLLPPIDDERSILQSPHLLSPIPIDTTSPNGSRAASISSRPQSAHGTFDPANPNAPLLKPLSVQPGSHGGTRPVSGESAPLSSAGSRPGSRPPSRPGSPTKSRPQTPTKDQNLRRRRSWLPGRSKVEVQEQEPGPEHTWQAWIVTPQEKRPYDVAALTDFQKVPIPISPP